MLVVFAIAIWKKVPTAIGKALDKKIGAIRDQLEEAAALRQEADELKREYQAKAAAAVKVEPPKVNVSASKSASASAGAKAGGGAKAGAGAKIGGGFSLGTK